MSWGGGLKFALDQRLTGAKHVVSFTTSRHPHVVQLFEIIETRGQPEPRILGEEKGQGAHGKLTIMVKTVRF